MTDGLVITLLLLAVIFGMPLAGIVSSVIAGVVRAVRRRRERAKVLLTSMTFHRAVVPGRKP